MNVLVLDVGGTHVKLAVAGHRRAAKFDSGPHLTPSRMVAGVKAAVADWPYDVISIGYPGPVVRGRPSGEPRNLGRGWVRYDFEKAFGCPVRIVNDAAMQALGSYEGGRMLFLGLGTGLGSAIIDDRHLLPLELAHLPYREEKSYEDYLGVRGLQRLGHDKWAKHVGIVVGLLRTALLCDYVVLGGGNVKKLKRLPRRARRGSNALAIRGGARLWEERRHAPSGSLPARR